MRIFISLCVFGISMSVMGQKKTLDHQAVDSWKTIKNQSISNNGAYVLYALEKGEKDKTLKVKSSEGNLLLEHERIAKAQFSYDSNFVIFNIKAWKDSVKALKRRKVKSSKLPKDSLAIYNLRQNEVHKVPMVRSYKIPEKWNGFLAYTIHDIPAKKTETDSVKKQKSSKKKPKKVNGTNGYHLIVRNLNSGREEHHFLCD